MFRVSIRYQVFLMFCLAVLAVTLSGCGAGTSAGGAGADAVSRSVALNGTVHGGQNPVSGATISLYAPCMGLTINGTAQTGCTYGSAASSLLTTTVTTDANGNFTITGDYTCPSSTAQVYITATGGNAGSGTNSNLALMTPLGSCGNLTSGTIISVDEVTTVAGAYALAQFMSATATSNAITYMGTSSTNVTGLTNAFATAKLLANTSIGLAPGGSLSYATYPVATLYTLANIIAGCVNTVSASGSLSTGCSTLFTNTKYNGVTPVDTMQAALYLALNPTLGPQSTYSSTTMTNLFGLQTGMSPFLPDLSTAPTDFTLYIQYSNTANALTLNHPYNLAIDAAGDVYIANQGLSTGSIVELSNNGSLVSPYGGYLGGGNLNQPSQIAIDTAGNLWVTQLASGANQVAVYNSTGTLLNSTGATGLGGVVANISGSPCTYTLDNGATNTGAPLAVTLSPNGSGPAGIAISRTGTVWVTNYCTGAISEFSTTLPSGGSLTPVGSSAAAGSTITTATSTASTTSGFTSGDGISYDATGASTTNPISIAFDNSTNVWIANYTAGSATGGSVSIIASTCPEVEPVTNPVTYSCTVGAAAIPYNGTTPYYEPATSTGSYAYTSTNFSSIAFDTNGRAWSAGTTGKSGEVFNNGAKPLFTADNGECNSSTNGGFTGCYTVVVDGNGNVWYTYPYTYGNSYSGGAFIENAAASSSTYSTSILTGDGPVDGVVAANHPYGAAIDSSGNLWLGGTKVVEYVGLAGPVQTPLSAQVAAKAQGTKP